MGLKCKIVYRDGQALALNEDGRISPLYLEALELYNNEEMALEVWATAHLQDFQDTFEIDPEQAMIQDVLTYLDTNSSKGQRLSAAESVQVKAFMVKNGISSLSDLDQTLSKIFKPNGFFEFNPQAMVDSKLWSPSDIPFAESKRKQIKDLLSNIAGELEVGNQYVVPNDKSLPKYKDSQNKTIFGTTEIVDVEEVYRAVENAIDNFTDRDEFYNKIKDVPFPEYVEEFYSNSTFANQEMARLASLKKVPVLSFVNGELSADNNATYTTLKNTLLANTNSISIEADLSYLSEIPISIWETSQESIKDIIKEVEAEAVKLNIDVIGLNEYSNQQEEVLGLLSSVNEVLQNPTEANIQKLALQKDTLMSQKEAKFVTELLPESLMGLNIIRLDSDKTDAELFEQHGLIKLGDNLYHKVKRGQISELYDFIYNEVVGGRINIPLKTQDLTNKVEVLKEITLFINTRETGIISELQEEISLNQVAFGHTKVEEDKISDLASISSDTDYLKTEFISDFYNYMLEEKLKNSEVYRDVLSHFVINDRDISLRGTKTPNIEGIKYEKELREYSTLKRDASLKAYTSTVNSGINEDLLALNNPRAIGEYKGEIVIDQDFAITPPAISTYIKFNNKLYRRVGNNNKVSVYQEIKTKPHPVYYTTNVNFKTDKSIVDAIMSRYPEGLSVQELTAEQRQENLKKARMTDVVPNKNFQVISEGNKLTGNDKVSFEAAKEMETKGKSREEIFKETRWFKVKGNQWRREIGDLVFEPQIDVDALAQELFKKGEVTIDLNDLFDTSEVENNMSSKDMKINLKYQYAEKEEFLGYASKRGDQNTIVFDIRGRGLDSLRGLLGGRPYRVFGTGVEKTATSMVNHEWQHLNQLEAGRKVGNSTKAIVEFYYRHNVDKIGRVTSNQQVLDKLATLYGVKDFVEEIAKPIYLNSIGEREAQEVEARLDDKSKAPSMFEDAIEYDIFDFTKGNVIVDNLGMSYMDASPTDLKFTKNLVEFIRQKGVQVVTDTKQMKAELEDSMPMIVGEKAASELDKLEEVTTRIDNLVIARKMEATGKSPLEIKRASLWERGSDKKWRFETLDGELKIDEIQHDKEYTISDLFEESDITKLYGDIKVTFTNEGFNNNITARTIDRDGAMSIVFNIGNIRSRNTYTKRTTTDIRDNWGGARDMVRDTLLHEGQHIAQKAEGFELGGNEFTAIRRAIEIIGGTPQSLESQLRIKAENYLRNNDKQQHRRLVEGLLEYLNTPNEFRQAVLTDLYTKLSGEVEARNAEKRSNMTLEEKRNKLLSETQDVATEDQLFLADAITPSEFYKYYNINAMVNAYHGSPYAFDKFTTEKMGTGEGVQAFGWGLYFTELESIATHYAKTLSNNKITTPLSNYQKGKNESFLLNNIFEYDIKTQDVLKFNLKRSTSPLDFEKRLREERSNIKRVLDSGNLQSGGYGQFTEEDLKNTYKLLKYPSASDIRVLIGSRNLYKVSLHKGKSPSEYTWIEWDKPINNFQKEILFNNISEASLVGEMHNIDISDRFDADSFDGGKTYRVGDTSKIGDSNEFTDTVYTNLQDALVEATRLNFLDTNIKGSDFYEALAKEKGQKQASLFLLENGIDGVKFPAESISRGATSDTARGFNYVVFDENAITIEERINFLQTPAGNVLGFEKNGIIYLDETQLNDVTTIHELKHVYDVITDIKAAQGDETAQKIIAKREELFNDEAEAAMQFHEGKVGVGEVSPMIIGENGAFNIQEINDKLAEAKKLKQDGVAPELIELQTGWFEQDGDWKYFSEGTLSSLKIKDGAQEELEVEKNLEDVIENEKLFEFYPELKTTKIIFYDGELRTEANNDERFANGFFRDGVIHVNINNRADAASENAGLYSRREVLGGIRNIRKDGRGWFSTNVIAHEISHRIQEIEGFPKGGNLSTIQTYIINKFGIKGGKIGEVLDQIREIEKLENLTENDKANLRGFKTIMEFRLDGLNPPMEVYSMLLGEIEARALEYAMAKLETKESLKDTTFQSIVDEMLTFENNKGKDVYSVKYQTQLKETIGLDLSSPLYAQRPSETRQEWKTRLLKEVEAYVVAPEVAENLENLRKENPSLWEQITSFINNLTTWLKEQIGLSDYKGDIMSMTKEEYVSALGVSILKDEYTVLPTYKELMDQYNAVQPFANGEIEIIYYHSEAEHEEIMNKIDECG